MATPLSDINPTHGFLFSCFQKNEGLNRLDSFESSMCKDTRRTEAVVRKLGENVHTGNVSFWLCCHSKQLIIRLFTRHTIQTKTSLIVYLARAGYCSYFDLFDHISKEWIYYLFTAKIEFPTLVISLHRAFSAVITVINYLEVVVFN